MSHYLTIYVSNVCPPEIKELDVSLKMGVALNKYMSSMCFQDFHGFPWNKPSSYKGCPHDKPRNPFLRRSPKDLVTMEQIVNGLAEGTIFTGNHRFFLWRERVFQAFHFQFPIFVAEKIPIHWHTEVAGLVMTRKPNRYRKIGQATLLGSCFGAGPAGFAAWQLLKKKWKMVEWRQKQHGGIISMGHLSINAHLYYTIRYIWKYNMYIYM